MELHQTLYVSDLDGTLLREDQTLSDRSVAYLRSAIPQGLNFTFATARSLVTSQFVISGLNLNLPVILYNGAQIYCPLERRYIHSAYMDEAVFAELLTQLLGDGLEPIVHCLDSEDNLRVYFQSASNASVSRWVNSRLAMGDVRFRVTRDFAEVETAKVIELMVVGRFEQLSPYAERYSRNSDVTTVFSEDLYTSEYHWLEITHAKANKGVAAEVLSHHLGLRHIVAFGDQANDLPLFARSSHSLAVSNAQASVRQAASCSIGHHNHDAVVEYLQTHVIDPGQ